jgi:hypothetical protein
VSEAEPAAAIEADPYDIESYRVYGDWLESNGDPLTIEHLELANELVRDLSSTPLGRQLVELDLSSSAGAKQWAANPPQRRLRVLRVLDTELTKSGAAALAAVAERVIARGKVL